MRLLKTLKEAEDIWREQQALADGARAVFEELLAASLKTRLAAHEKEHEKLSYFLWYDNGTGHFNCASRHKGLDAAIAAAKRGWQTDQHITNDPGGENVIWRNYS